MRQRFVGVANFKNLKSFICCRMSKVQKINIVFSKWFRGTTGSTFGWLAGCLERKSSQACHPGAIVFEDEIVLDWAVIVFLLSH